MSSQARPAWQTDDLDEEWVEQSDDELEAASLSLTEPLDSKIRVFTSKSLEELDISVSSMIRREGMENEVGQSSGGTGTFRTANSFPNAGTFLIREDIPDVPLQLLPKTPGRNANKVKDIFTPMALERMFEPPSPPQPHQNSSPSPEVPLPIHPSARLRLSAPVVPSRLSQAYVPSDASTELTDMPEFEGIPRQRVTSFDAVAQEAKFTFTSARPSSVASDSASASLFPPDGSGSTLPSPGIPAFASTPHNTIGPATTVAPMTDPRLRLFQFKYDTYTRDHLSALVDSIAVTPSGASENSPTTQLGPFSSSPVPSPLYRPQLDPREQSTSHLRSVKRVKLTPAEGYLADDHDVQFIEHEDPDDEYGEGDGAGAFIARPRELVVKGNQMVSPYTHGGLGRRAKANEPSGPPPNIQSRLADAAALRANLKEHRDFSTISTVASYREGPSSVASPAVAVPTIAVVDEDQRRTSTAEVFSSRLPPRISPNPYNAQQGMDMIAQIKQGLKASGRLASGTTNGSISYADSEASKSLIDANVSRPFLVPPSRTAASPRRPSGHSQRSSPAKSRAGVSPGRNRLSSANRSHTFTSQTASSPAKRRPQHRQTSSHLILSPPVRRTSGTHRESEADEPPPFRAMQSPAKGRHAIGQGRPGGNSPRKVFRKPSVSDDLSRDMSHVSLEASSRRRISAQRVHSVPPEGEGLWESSMDVSPGAEVPDPLASSQWEVNPALLEEDTQTHGIRADQEFSSFKFPPPPPVPSSSSNGRNNLATGHVRSRSTLAPKENGNGNRSDGGVRVIHERARSSSDAISRASSISSRPSLSRSNSSNVSIRPKAGLATSTSTRPLASIGSTSTVTTAVAGPSQPPTLRSHPSTSLRSEPNTDLNRFVSSSTAASGTTNATSATIPSFTKHAGSLALTPKVPAQITRIAPEDIPALPQRVGRMVFDTVRMCWVKDTAGTTRASSHGSRARRLSTEDESQWTGTGTESEDPFRDIESLREDGDSRSGSGPRGVPEMEEMDEESFALDGNELSRIDEMSRIEEGDEQSEVDDEEMELNSFAFDHADGDGDVDDMQDDISTESDSGMMTEDGAEEDTTDMLEHRQPTFDSEQEEEDDEMSSRAASPPRHTISFSGYTTPLPVRTLTGYATLPRSALKSGSATPQQHQTPMNTLGHRRSVSFSDGRREGPIRNSGDSPRPASEGDESLEEISLSRDREGGTGGNGTTSFMPSARSKRIADMLNGLDDGDESNPLESPSRPGRVPRSTSTVDTRRPDSTPGGTSRRVFSRSKTQPGRSNNANATFLTECSFGVSHDRLVQVITDVQPFEPHWEELAVVDLGKKELESVARLKEFLPKLDSLTLNHNKLSFLSGIPLSVRTLAVSHNMLTGITSFSHILNIENLDISHNELDSLHQLECLRHLRELRADSNRVTSIDGLQKLSGLVKLSLQGNSIRDIDLANFRWTRLEMLNVSHNRLDNIVNLSALPSLIALNVDSNVLSEISPGGTMPRLRILRTSNNKLHQLDVLPFFNLRTLYADNNSLTTLTNAERLTKVENLSLRNQSIRSANRQSARQSGFDLLTRDIRDAKRLYLSGNPLQSGFLSEPCYNLVYLEMAACRLSSLPDDLVRLLPNLRVLNLNYNFLEDPKPLSGLGRLQKLTIIGSRLKGTKPLIRLLQHMPELEMLDFRMNPCTLGWYLPLLVRDMPGALQPSEARSQDEPAVSSRKSTESAWQDLDAKFRRDLPDDAYIGRLAYRGLVMRACPRVKLLDGVQVTEKERIKAGKLLEGILAGKTSKRTATSS